MAKLFHFSSQKKLIMQEERKKIIEDGFIEREMKFFTKTIHSLFQAEIDRYLAFSHLIKGYYRGLEQKPVEEFTGHQTCAVNIDVHSFHTRIFLRLRSKKAKYTNIRE